jgi:hypothetical protein
MWLTFLLLAVPAGHQVVGHKVHLKFLRLFQPGLAVPATVHEHNHASRSRAVRAVADLGWLAYLAGALAAGLILAR